MIYTGEWPLSPQLSEALQSAATRAVARQSQFVTCEDLLLSLVGIPGSEAAEIWSALKPSPESDASHQKSRAVEVSGNTPADAMASVRASRPLQEAIELSSNGVSITTGSLLIGLFRVRRSAVLADLALKGVTEGRLRELLQACEREMVVAR